LPVEVSIKIKNNFLMFTRLDQFHLINVLVDQNVRITESVVLDHSSDQVLECVLTRDGKSCPQFLMEVLPHVLGEHACKLDKQLAEL